jgi:hypothetical protein
MILNLRKRIGTDNDAFMVNIGAGVVLGYALMALSAISFWFYRMDWFQDGFMGTIWTFAPFIFALGAMVITSRTTMDPKIIIAMGIVAAVFYYLFFVMG